MEKMKKLIRWLIELFRTRPYSAILLLWPVEIAWYSILNHTQTLETSHVIYTPLDDKIPYIKYFVYIYVSWFVFIFCCLCYTLIKSKKDFLRCSTSALMGMYPTLLFCTLFPSWHLLRPADTGGGLSGFIVSIIYASDNPAVIYPSMHVLVSLLLAIRMTFAESMKGKPVWKAFIIIHAVLICLSTVFIKQHSVADVLLALVLVPVYDSVSRFLIWPDRRFEKKDAAKTKKENENT